LGEEGRTSIGRRRPFSITTSQGDDSSSLMHNILDRLDGLHTFVSECFDSFDSRIDAMDARFPGMDTRITKLEEDVSYVHQCFDLPPSSS